MKIEKNGKKNIIMLRGDKMSTELGDNIDEIERQKNLYLTPNNLRKGVTVLGVEGQYGPVESISVNGVAQTPDENNNVNISVPTATSDLQNDSDFISSTVITAFWKGTQAEYDALGTYSSTTLYLIEEE